MSSFFNHSCPRTDDVINFSNVSTDTTSFYNQAPIQNPATGYDEQEQPQTSRTRRSSRPDHVKHRRTKNGCYTCRSRRIKCDEQHPTCERCSKGKRECIYPEPRPNPRPNTSSRRSKVEQQAADYSRSPSIEDEDIEEESHSLSERRVRPTASRHQSSSSTSQTQGSNLSDYFTNFPAHNTLQGDSAKIGQCLSPSTGSSSAPASAGLEQPQKFSSVSTSASHNAVSWSHLPGDLQFYLEYHQKHITYHHYFFKHRTEGFLHTVLYEQAMRYDPLLYAVVGFAAFHMTVKRQNGRIQDFLGYYDKAVSLLRKSLAGGQVYTDATLLTTLQLATFEEYLGDYVSLLSHQQAAHRMLLDFYLPDTVMDSEVGRQASEWYSRLDLTSGLMSENGTTLSREWYLANELWYQSMTLQHPSRIDFKIHFAFARLRTFCADLALLFSKLARGPMTVELRQEIERCEGEMMQWFADLGPTFKDEQYLVKDFNGRVADPEDIVNPYVEIWREPLFALNFMLLDWTATSIMFKMKISQAMQLPLPPELSNMALEACRLFETIEYWPDSPSGSVLKIHSSLGIASLFLPKDEKHTMWCRRKLAKVESLGHVYPPAFRQRMASIWNLPEINQWWIPNEEGYPAVIRSIRECMGNRLPQAASKSRSEDQRNIKGIFSNLTMQDETEDTLTGR